MNKYIRIKNNNNQLQKLYIIWKLHICTSVLLCLYMHRLQWSLIAKKSECLVDPISMLLSQLLSQLRPQMSSSPYMFEAIKLWITSFRKPGRLLNREFTWFCRPGRTLDREYTWFVGCRCRARRAGV